MAMACHSPILVTSGPLRLTRGMHTACFASHLPAWRQTSFFRKSSTKAFRESCFTTRRTGKRSSLQVNAFVREWPDPEFVKETLEAFPEKQVATVEEARALFSNGGYTYLDVRPALELEEIGRVKGSVNVPFVHATRKWSSEEQKKVTSKTPNEQFEEEIQKKFPDKEAKLLVACSDGRTYSIDVLEALDDLGYTNLVWLKSGYYGWFQVFDHKLGRRRTGEYAEQYTHDGDSCGVHASGAGFERVDPKEKWVPPSF